MKSNRFKISALALALVSGFSASAFAQQPAPAQMAVNPATPATQVQAAPVVAPAVAPVEAPAVSGKKEAVNPFSGRTYGNESLQRELDQLRLNNALAQERLKQRKDEMEMFRLEQEAIRLMKGASAVTTAPVNSQGAVAPQTSTVQTPGVKPVPTPVVEEEAPIKKPLAKDKKRMSLKDIAAYEKANEPVPEKPKEKVLYFTPPVDKNLVEPKLIGIVQKDELKTAILSYNGVTIRVPEGGTVAGNAISGVGNGRVMWGNKALFATGFVEGARVERTDFELPATGQPPQVANSLKVLQEGEMAKKAYKAGLNMGKVGATGSVGGNLPQAANSNTLPAPVNNNSAANRLPPPPPILK